MEKYFKKKSTLHPLPNRSNYDSYDNTEVNIQDLPTDLGLRPCINDYDCSIRDQVQRAYLQRGPCQPKDHDFKYMKFGNQHRRFVSTWFNDFKPWLEYSIQKEAVFCLFCYLLKEEKGEQAGGDTFIGKGFKNWKKKEYLTAHIGGNNSAHNQARRDCENLMNQKQHIETFLSRQSVKIRSDYEVRLNTVVACIRFLLKEGLPFRGHDESDSSSNQGNFLELLHFLANHNEDIGTVTFRNAPLNMQTTSPKIQKDVVSCASVKTTNAIIREMDNALFSVLIDESRDISVKEQMVVVLRYVDKNGYVVERFIGIEHVTSTTAVSLKEAIDKLFSRHGLSLSKLRGQGYDGASNMQGEFNGLKTLILEDNECAYYVHCFAHQLQLALIYVAKKHGEVNSFFNLLSMLVNVVGASTKRRDILLEKHAIAVIEALDKSELQVDKDLIKRLL